MLIGSVPGGAFAIVHGDREAVDADGVRRPATARNNLQSHTATVPRNRLSVWNPKVSLMVPKDPLSQSMVGVLLTSDHASFPIGSAAAAMVKFI